MNLWYFLLYPFIVSAFHITQQPHSLNYIIEASHPCQPKHETSCVVFFSGCRALLPYDLYSNFIHRLVQENITVCVPHMDQDNIIDVKDIEDYKEIIFMSHSSGSIDALNNCHHAKVHKMIFIDPTKTSNHVLLPNNIDAVLFLHSELSYSGIFPFIPTFLKLSMNDVKASHRCISQIINIHRFGHVDILNPSFSNIIHRLIKSNTNRTFTHLDEYHQRLSLYIKGFINRSSKSDNKDR